MELQQRLGLKKKAKYSFITMAQSEFCTTTTLENNISLIGTASANTSIWFLLEVPRPWAAKALVNNELPNSVNSTLNRWVESTPKSRAVFIKKNNQPVTRPTLFVAITEDNDQRIHQYNLKSDYSDLTDIRIEDVLANDDAGSKLFDESLYLVCTNGKRDNCCTKFGLPIIKAFEAENETNVWRCTHLGGHKFAAVVGVYPSGLYYQLYNPADVPAFKQAIDQNEIPLKGLRGRTAYSGAAQAAEYFLRQHTGDLNLNAYSLVSAEDQGESWQVIFQNGVAQYQLDLSISLSEPSISGCNGKLKPSPLYKLLAIS